MKYDYFKGFRHQKKDKYTTAPRTNDMMKIGMILDNEFTGDMRVENEVISLVAAGYQVFVLCFNYGGKQAREDFHGASIIRINVSTLWKNKTKALTNTLFDLYTPFWAKKIRSFVSEYQIDVLHIHDLHLLGAAFKAKKKLGTAIPIVADLHENYPEALKYYKYTQTFPGNILISIPRWKKTEIKWVNKSDHVITVIEEAVDKYKKLGLNADKIRVVANYVNSDEFMGSEFDENILNKFTDHFVITYVGGFDLHRGLESVIRALPYIKEDIPSIKLVLIGRGKNGDDLKALAQSLSVSDLVSFEGWQAPSALPSYIEMSNVCLIPHLKTGHTDNTIPHKLFQYMLLGKVVLASDCNPLKRILEDTKAGLVHDSDNEKDLASQVIYLYQHEEERTEMGENGRKAVMETYNWPLTARNLVQLYEEIGRVQ